MTSSALQAYARGILGHIPWEHWTLMAVVSLALTVILLIRKKCSVYGAMAWGVTAFMGLFLLDTAVGIRYLGLMKHGMGQNLTLDISHLFQRTGQRSAENISNIAAFIPFGFFLSEFLASTKSVSTGRRLGLGTLAGFGLSLTIECLQLLLHVGFFELTDLVLNTVGGVIGAGMSVGVKGGCRRTISIVRRRF